jgi:hypothetical protein
MATLKLNCEPYEISARFYHAVQEKALLLEEDAENDEILAASIEHPCHQQRHRLLAQTQRNEAERFRDFLAASRVRLQ